MSAFVDSHREGFGVEPICREIEVSASAYRARRVRPPSARSPRDAWLLAQIHRVHADSAGIYGQLKIWDDLNDEGIKVARCTVERLMRAHGIEGLRNGKTQRTTLPGASPVAAPDLVRRDFTADRPDGVWLCDFTYIRTWEGWSYLAVVLDVHTRRIVGWQLASHMRQSLVTDALDMALAAHQEHEDGLVAHSDNGSQYTSYEYTERLKRAGIAPSRGRSGTALDCHGRERDGDTQAGAPQALHVEDPPGSRTRPGDLHRPVQRPAPAPLAQADEQRADETASTPAGTRAV
ncbi:MAG TPA: IS3 family transposase [Coriobacteriia bacterium]